MCMSIDSSEDAKEMVFKISRHLLAIASRSFLILVFVAVGTATGTASDSMNLIENPSMDLLDDRGWPRGWEGRYHGAEATFTPDNQTAHSGKGSLRIDVPGPRTRAFLSSSPILVAPGESFRVGAWVKQDERPPDNGAKGERVMLIVNFCNEWGENLGPPKLVNRAKPTAEWQFMEGKVTAPARAASMRVRMGFSYSSGTAWWDEVFAEAENLLAARHDLERPRLSPGISNLPIVIFNRRAHRGATRLELTWDGGQTSHELRLSGDPVQRIDVPVRVERRGPVELELSLFAGKKLEASYRQKVKLTVPAVLSMQPLMPTHWVVEDGTPRVEGELELAATEEARENGCLSVRVHGDQDDVLAEWEFPHDRPMPNGRIFFSVSAPGLEQGEYRVVATFESRDYKPEKVDTPWFVIPRKAARVVLAENGFPERNGRAFFPLGLFNGTGKLEESAEAGFTVSHAYNAVLPAPGHEPDWHRAKAFLDKSEAAGLHALYIVPRRWAEEGKKEEFSRPIRMFRNHPGLLAWNEEEEIARGDMRLETLGSIYQDLKRQDPHHPMMVGDANKPVFLVQDRADFFPVEFMDMGMWWWYPIPLGINAGQALQGEELEQSYELAPPTFLTRRQTDKPVWVGLQAYKKPIEAGRYPVPLEYRTMAYIALIHGAKGLVWYGGAVTGGILRAPEEGHWEELKALIGELREIEEMLMAPEVDPPAFSPAEAPISVGVRKLRNKTLLMMANRGREKVEIGFSGIDVDGHARVHREARTALIRNGCFTESFEAYGSHIYLIESATDPDP